MMSPATIIGKGDVLPFPSMNVDVSGTEESGVTEEEQRIFVSSRFAIVNLSKGPPSQIKSFSKTSWFGTAW